MIEEENPLKEIPSLHSEADDTLRRTESLEQELCRAASKGELEDVRRILELKNPSVNVNCTNDKDMTPLELIAQNVQKDQVNEQTSQMIHLLIKNGADSEIAILQAIKKENIDLLKTLLDYALRHGKSQNRSCVSSSLMLATKVGNYEMVECLMTYGEKVEERDQTCECDVCIHSARTIDRLKRFTTSTCIPRTIDRLKRFITLSSPLYISAQYLVESKGPVRPAVDTETAKTSHVYRACRKSKILATILAGEDCSSEYDPIYKAFELCEKLKKL